MTITYLPKYIGTNIVLFSALINPVIFAAPSTSVKVIEAIQPALYRCWYHSDWQKIAKNLLLPSDCLVQIEDGGKAVFTWNTPDANLKKKETLLTVEQPLIARIDERFLRKIQLSKRFYRMASEQKNKFADKGVLYKIEEAWKRFEVYFSLNEKFAPEFSPFGKGDEVKLDQGHQNLDLLMPQNDTLITAPELPYPLGIKWQPLREGGKEEYQIKMWRKDEKPKTIATVSNTREYTVPVYVKGSYYVQIASTDGKWQSSPHLFHLFENKKQDQLSGRNPKKIELQVNNPKRDHIIFTVAPSANVVFSWEKSQSSTSLSYQLTVFDSKKKALKKIVTEDLSVIVPLNIGNYSWSLSYNFSEQAFWQESGSYGNLQVRAASDDHFSLLTFSSETKKSLAITLENGL